MCHWLTTLATRSLTQLLSRENLSDLERLLTAINRTYKRLITISFTSNFNYLAFNLLIARTFTMHAARSPAWKFNDGIAARIKARLRLKVIDGREHNRAAINRASSLASLQLVISEEEEIRRYVSNERWRARMHEHVPMLRIAIFRMTRFSIFLARGDVFAKLINVAAVVRWKCSF
jgi:hypothetical protein